MSKAILESYKKVLTENSDVKAKAVEIIKSTLTEAQNQLEDLFEEHNLPAALIIAEGIIMDVEDEVEQIVRLQIDAADNVEKEDSEVIDLDDDEMDATVQNVYDPDEDELEEL